MADNFDKLLFSIGAQADGEVPYLDALKAIKAKTELERARRKKRDRYIRILSVAASLVVVLGVGTMLLSRGFFAGSAAPMAASDQATAKADQDAPAEMTAASNAQPAPALYAESAAPAASSEPAASFEAAAPEAAEPESSQMPMLGIAPTDGGDVQNSGDADTAAGGIEQDSEIRTFAVAPDAEIISLGIPKAVPSPTDVSSLSDESYTLQALTIDEAPCEIGEAAIYQLDDITLNALWRIGEKDYLSITSQSMNKDELIALIKGMAE